MAALHPLGQKVFGAPAAAALVRGWRLRGSSRALAAPQALLHLLAVLLGLLQPSFSCAFASSSGLLLPCQLQECLAPAAPGLQYQAAGAAAAVAAAAAPGLLLQASVPAVQV